MGLLTILVCMVIADGFIGIEGSIHDYKEFTSITTTFWFWLVQAMVLWAITFLRFIIGKIVIKTKGGE